MFPFFSSTTLNPRDHWTCCREKWSNPLQFVTQWNYLSLKKAFVFLNFRTPKCPECAPIKIFQKSGETFKLSRGDIWFLLWCLSKNAVLEQHMLRDLSAVGTKPGLGWQVWTKHILFDRPGVSSNSFTFSFLRQDQALPWRRWLVHVGIIYMSLCLLNTSLCLLAHSPWKQIGIHRIYNM